MDKLPSHKLIAGALFSIIGLLLITGNIRVRPVQTSESFSSEPIELSGFGENEAEANKVPERLIIPSLDIYIEVERAELVNGYWEVFEHTAGWGEGSGVPGEPGNQVIFAHAREGMFESLKKAQQDMHVLVLTDESWYEYKITSISEVYPGNTEFIEQTENEILTLYTCSGFQDSKRLIVVAEPV